VWQDVVTQRTAGDRVKAPCVFLCASGKGRSKAGHNAAEGRAGQRAPVAVLHWVLQLQQLQGRAWKQGQEDRSRSREGNKVIQPSRVSTSVKHTHTHMQAPPAHPPTHRPGCYGAGGVGGQLVLPSLDSDVVINLLVLT
jgi:hypothetical protein